MNSRLLLLNYYFTEQTFECPIGLQNAEYGNRNSNLFF